eukprot:TRINITY_DN6394_c0_g1_i4.p1 TRINITY_DN6394_c0_g1~~TRINITY_DN6394_c0_g1_i4.p1  ORF type:complete len:210 (-),score=56.62 TRINITY_DN6394_c0_g1_i4:173-802(-)
MECIWSHILYDELKVVPEEMPVLHSDPPLNPKGDREKMTQIMFETFKIPAIYVARQPVLALYSSGRTTGVVVEVGEGNSHVLPIYEGYGIMSCIQKMDTSGAHISSYLSDLLKEKGHDLSHEKEVVQEMKEKVGYVAVDYSKELCKPPETIKTVYQLPDGHKITLGTERFKCTEALFCPSHVGKEGPGLAEVIHNTILMTDVDLIPWVS